MISPAIEQVYANPQKTGKCHVDGNIPELEKREYNGKEDMADHADDSVTGHNRTETIASGLYKSSRFAQ